MLKGSAFVDPDNVLIFGHSMGGVMAPLLGAEIPVKGIAVYGTIAKTWTEYILENVRRQMTLVGADFPEIDRTMRADAAIEQSLIAGLSPAEIAARHPELKEQIEGRYTEGKYYFGTHYVYFRQLAGKNLAEAWERFGGPTLAAWGKADFLSGAGDHELIARIVNRAHPGRAVFLALDGIDHSFSPSASQEESLRDFRKPNRPYNPAFLERSAIGPSGCPTPGDPIKPGTNLVASGSETLQDDLETDRERARHRSEGALGGDRTLRPGVLAGAAFHGTRHGERGRPARLLSGTRVGRVDGIATGIGEDRRPTGVLDRAALVQRVSRASVER